MTTPTSSDSSPLRARPATRSFAWSFPSGAPVLRPLRFAVRRELADGAGLLAAPEGSADPLPRTEAAACAATFEVTLEAAEQEGASIIRARLDLEAAVPRPFGEQARAAEELAVSAEGLELGAEIWTQCYATSDGPTKAALLRVLGAPDFDGFIALRLLTYRASMYAEELVRLALFDAARKDELARAPEAHTQLTAVLLGALDELRALLGTSGPFAPGALEGGVPLWTARLAAYVEGLDQKELAERLRVRGREQAEKTGELWSLWMPTEDRPPLYALSVAALALWRSKVRPSLEHNAPAVARGVLGKAIETYHRRTPLPPMVLGISVERAPDGTEIERIDAEHRDRLIQRLRLVGPVTDSVILDALTDKTRATRSMTGQLLLRHLFDVGYRQKEIEKRSDFRNYMVQGGLAEICRILGRKVFGDEVDLLRRALDGYELIRIPLPNSGFDGLLKWSERKAAPGRKAEVQIIMMDPILPNYVHSLPKATPAHKEARVLIPIPSKLPALTGSPNTYGQKMLLQMLTMESLAMGWRQYAREGVHLPQQAWDRLADRAELDRKEAGEARRAFVAGSEDTPPFLVELPGDRYRLAPAHRDSERVILEGAGVRLDASELSQTKRAKKKKSSR